MDGTGNATIVAGDIDNGSSDNCSVASLSASQTAFTSADLGANNVTLTVTDGSGNTATCNATVTVEDVINPTAVCQNITVQLDGTGNVSIVAADIDGGSSDNTGIASLAASQTAFTCADLGANTVTLTVTDLDGNTATCDATVTVEDNVDPTAICQDITIQLDGTGNATIVAGDIDNGSSDNCSVASLSASQTAFTSADLGANNVTLTVTDGSGNTATCNATVTVEDTQAPVANCKDITIQLDATGNVSITGTDIDNGSTDNTGIASLVATPNTFACSDIGDNAVTLTVTDLDGNTSSCTAIVTVQVGLAAVAPTITGSDTTCQGTEIIYSTEVGMDNYAWSISAGGTITGGSVTTNTITVRWTDIEAQTVEVDYTSLAGCPSVAPAEMDIWIWKIPEAGPVNTIDAGFGN